MNINLTSGSLGLIRFPALILAGLLTLNCFVPKIRTFYEPDSTRGELLSVGSVGHLVHSDQWASSQGYYGMTARLIPMGRKKLCLRIQLNVPNQSDSFDENQFILTTSNGSQLKPADTELRTWYVGPLDPYPDQDWTVHQLELIYHTDGLDLSNVTLNLSEGALKTETPVRFESIHFQRRKGFDVYFATING